MSANQVRLMIVADENEVERALGIPQPDLCLFGGRLPVVRGILNEAVIFSSLSFSSGRGFMPVKSESFNPSLSSGTLYSRCDCAFAACATTALAGLRG